MATEKEEAYAIDLNFFLQRLIDYTKATVIPDDDGISRPFY